MGQRDIDLNWSAGRDEAGNAIKVDDPLAAQFGEIAARHRDDPRGLALSLLGVRAIFGDDLPRDARFADPVADWLEKLYTLGAARTVADAVGMP